MGNKINFKLNKIIARFCNYSQVANALRNLAELRKVFVERHQFYGKCSAGLFSGWKWTAEPKRPSNEEFIASRFDDRGLNLMILKKTFGGWAWFQIGGLGNFCLVYFSVNSTLIFSKIDLLNWYIVCIVALLLEFQLLSSTQTTDRQWLNHSWNFTSVSSYFYCMAIFINKVILRWYPR